MHVDTYMRVNTRGSGSANFYPRDRYGDGHGYEWNGLLCYELSASAIYISGFICNLGVCITSLNWFKSLKAGKAESAILEFEKLIGERMSGAQGAQPKGSLTPTVYESVEGGQNKTKTDIRSTEDQGGIQIDKIQDKVKDAAGKGGPVFGAGKDEDKQDLGVTGTG